MCYWIKKQLEPSHIQPLKYTLKSTLWGVKAEGFHVLLNQEAVLVLLLHETLHAYVLSVMTWLPQ